MRATIATPKPISNTGSKNEIVKPGDEYLHQPDTDGGFQQTGIQTNPGNHGNPSFFYFR